jgi:GTPase SAR1 family protein
MRNKKILIIGDSGSGVSTLIEALSEDINRIKKPVLFVSKDFEPKAKEYYNEIDCEIRVYPPFGDSEEVFNYDLPPKKDFNHPNAKSVNDSMNFISDKKRAELRRKRKNKRR